LSIVHQFVVVSHLWKYWLWA